LLQCYWSFPAAGGNPSLSLDSNDQLDFNFIASSATELAPGAGCDQAAANSAGQLDPNGIDDATFADIWSDWTQSLPESAPAPAFEFEPAGGEEVAAGGEGLNDLFAYLQESAFQEAQQVAAF
jgi:hypothetical protein